MTKALGSEIKEFYRQASPPGYYYGYYSWQAGKDEVESLKDNKMYDLSSFGCFYPCSGESNPLSFKTLFDSWQKTRTYAFITIRVPKEREGETQELLTCLGLEVKK